jgi:hypothetical protein
MMSSPAKVPAAKRPSMSAAPTPTSKAPINGGMRRPSAGATLSTIQVMAIGPAITKSSCKARTRSSPKRRKTPATIPITIGIGTAAIARRTQPVILSTNINEPVR